MKPMQSGRSSTAVLVLGCAIVAVASWLPMHAGPQAGQAPEDEIPYQARLLDSNGQPVTQTGLSVTFRVYQFAASGTPLHMETDIVDVADGLVTTRIGPLPSALLLAVGDLYLGVTYGSDAEMQPRTPLGSVPFALRAKYSPPPGTISMYGGSVAPEGYLICDGSAVSRSTYADLFAVVGTAFGPGDGATTFQLPDMRAKFPRGVAAAGAGSTLGAGGGSASASLAHTHTMAHGHSANCGSSNSNGVNFWIQAGGVGVPALGNHEHSISIGGSSAANTGSSLGVVATEPPYVALNYIIKA